MVTKTLDERLKEMLLIYSKLKELGMSEHVCFGLADFKKIANTFVKEGYSVQGRIPLDEIQRTLVYHLSIVPHVVSSVNLLIDP